MNHSFHHTRHRLLWCVLLWMLFGAVRFGWARGPYSVAVPLAVDYPVLTPLAPRTTRAWRQGVGEWGENFIRHGYELRGYEVRTLKSTGGQGIDLIAYKRNSAGGLIDVKICEAKTGRTPGSLGETGDGLQLGEKWTEERLRNAADDPETKQLVEKVLQYRQAQGLTFEQMGELQQISTKAGWWVTRRAATGEVMSDQSVERFLGKLAQRTGSPETRVWANRHLQGWSEVRKTTESLWLNEGRTAAALERTSESAAMRGVAEATAESSGRAISRVAARFAGPVAVAAAFGYDAWQAYGTISDYRANRICRREMVVTLSGIGGGAAGAAGGAWAGAQAGAMFVPVAEFTVPAGMFIGGVVGYYVGSSGAKRIGGMYEQTDPRIQAQVDDWILHTSYAQAHP